MDRVTQAGSVVVGVVLVLVIGAVMATRPTSTPSSSSSSPSSPSPSGKPFEMGARRHARGVVTAVEVAGSYAYVSVRGAGDVGVVATLGVPAVVGDDVELTLFGRRDVFASKRLGKTFAPLDFGIVSPRR